MLQGANTADMANAARDGCIVVVALPTRNIVLIADDAMRLVIHASCGAPSIRQPTRVFTLCRATVKNVRSVIFSIRRRCRAFKSFLPQYQTFWGTKLVAVAVYRVVVIELSCSVCLNSCWVQHTCSHLGPFHIIFSNTCVETFRLLVVAVWGGSVCGDCLWLLTTVVGVIECWLCVW